MDWLTLFVTGLAAWRLANLLVNEQGPFAIFARLRYTAGIRQIVTRDSDGIPVGVAYSASNELAAALMCVWCTGFWTALFCALMPLIPEVGVVFMWLNRVLAISALVVITHEIVGMWRGLEE